MERTETRQWNPKYAAYATEHGKTPEEMLAHDKKLYPGGCMAGFLIWSHAHPWPREEQRP